MEEFGTFNPGIKFNPDYTWPEEGTEKPCPNCNNPLTLNEKRTDYMGKPWWCGGCRWQFIDEEVS
tara:strand:+ start:17417 stop:17611 length:195 start_codon:yes stop_codon:yes gene_type:complete